jgi:hypothetical protein
MATLASLFTVTVADATKVPVTVVSPPAAEDVSTTVVTPAASVGADVESLVPAKEEVKAMVCPGTGVLSWVSVAVMMVVAIPSAGMRELPAASTSTGCERTVEQLVVPGGQVLHVDGDPELQVCPTESQTTPTQAALPQVVHWGGGVDEAVKTTVASP